MNVSKPILSVLLLAVSLGLSTTGFAAKKNKISKGARVTLHQQVTIPANRASIFIQGGRVLSYSAVDLYHAHCKFEVRTIAKTPRVIKPGSFTITKAWEMEAGLKRPMLVASRFGGGGSGGSITFSTYMRLSSAEQPEVIMLTCEIFGPANLTEHLTPAEIRQALGKVLTIK